MGILQGCVLEYRHMSTLACLITCTYTVSSIIYSDIYQRRHQISVLLILLERSPLVSRWFTSQRASNNGHHMFPCDHIILELGRLHHILHGCVLQQRHMSTLACQITGTNTVYHLFRPIWMKKSGLHATDPSWGKIYICIPIHAWYMNHNRHY